MVVGVFEGWTVRVKRGSNDSGTFIGNTLASWSNHARLQSAPSQLMGSALMLKNVEEGVAEVTAGRQPAHASR